MVDIKYLKQRSCFVPIICIISFMFNQEVLVYNGESGEYQKFFYISEHEATTEEEAVEVHHEDEASDNMNGFEQVCTLVIRLFDCKIYGHCYGAVSCLLKCSVAQVVV